MGLIIGRFRSKKSTYDVLEKLEKEIISIEEFSRSTELYRKKVITRFILLAIAVYFILACILYLYYNKISPNLKLVYGVPFLAFPFIIYLIKKFLAWYYSRKIQKNEKKLIKLKEEKKKILDNVIETETYKVAKKILDKFANEKKQPIGPEGSFATTLVPRTSQTGLRQRQPYGQSSKTRLSFGTPKTPTEVKNLALDKVYPQSIALGAGLLSRPVSALPTPRLALAAPSPGGSPLSMPRSILPSNRSALDKMVDYLVGDGPSNRYALICKNCSSHNGMALKEEFEYLSFRCCYCAHFNTARKKKPTGPKFEASPTLRIAQVEDTSESDDEDTADSEPEVKKNIKDVDRRSYLEPEVETLLDFQHEPVVAVENIASSSSPEGDKISDIEKHSDFDKLSDIDFRESGDGIVQSPESGDGVVLSPESGDGTKRFGISSDSTVSSPLSEDLESPMDTEDIDKSRTDLETNKS